MTTPAKRWPMIGPPTAAAINPSGFGRANPPTRNIVLLKLSEYERLVEAGRRPEPLPASAAFSDGLSAAVALVTAKLEGIPATAAELADDVDPAAIIRCLVLLTAELLQSALTVSEADDLLESPGLAAQEPRQ